MSVSSAELYNEGCYNTILDMDSLMFINFTRLRETVTPELKGAYRHLLGLFTRIGKLLLASKNEHDLFWKNAYKLLEMSEFEGICLGYAINSTSGSGSGKNLKKTILNVAKEILDAGIKEPEIFELVGLFEDNIGPDRLSDFIAHTIQSYLEEYTKRVLSNIGVNQKTRKKIKFCDGLVENPYNGKRLYFLPIDILHELPIAKEWEDIETVCLINAEMRNEINTKIGEEWQKMTSHQRKVAARKILHHNPKLFKGLINDYRKFKLPAYDFLKDPLGEASWLNAVHEYTQKYPIVVQNKGIANISELRKIVLTICNKYKELVESNGLNELLYCDNKPRKERIAQKLFFGIADAYCKSNNLDINPEPNAGRGAVDFKFSSGYRARIIVEVKLTRNNQIVHGYEKQIKEYQKAERNANAIYLVIDNGGNEKKLDKLINIYNEQQMLKKNNCELIIIDGNLKPSASKI